MEFSSLKTRIDTLFTAFQLSADAGELPDVAQVSTFVQLAEKMHMCAPDNWLNEAEDFLHLARQLHSAVKQHKIQDSVLLLDALQDAQEFCHRTHRKHG